MCVHESEKRCFSNHSCLDITQTLGHLAAGLLQDLHSYRSSSCERVLSYVERGKFCSIAELPALLN